MIKKYYFKVFLFATAVTGAMVLSSCSHDDYTYNEEKVQENNHAKDVARYEQAFVSRFGQPASDQCWDYTLSNSQLTRSTRKTKEGELAEWPRESFNNFGYTWKYATGDEDPMKENIVSTIFHNDLSALLELIADDENYPAQEWNPSGTIIYRPIATVRTSSANDKYFSIGANLGVANWYLRQSHVHKKDNNNFMGNTSGQHTSAINFDEVNKASSVAWFASATDGHKDKIDAADYKLEYFKVIPYNGMVFWCFKCEEGGSYADYIWWVQEISNVPTYKYSKRFFVEDLGGQTNGDIDFNDIVFDVVEYTDNTQKCIVRALGGTLPISINVCGIIWSKPEKTVGVMENTGADGKEIDPYKVIDEFSITGWNPLSNDQISVTVQDKDNFSFVTKFPKDGDIPYMVAFSTAKQWNGERVPVTSEWLQLPTEE